MEMDGSSSASKPRRGAFASQSREMEPVHPEREAFKRRGTLVMQNRGAYDLRRIMGWAPYLVVPSVAIASRAVPKEHRVNLWIGTLVFYGLVSVVMYNTDTGTDYDTSPPLVLAREGEKR